MLKIKILTTCLIISLSAIGQTTEPHNTLSVLFIGDIMGHDTQINAAYDEINKRYSYDGCFQFVKPIISEAGIAIANLEVTLAGPPYKGYPNFSSPDELAVALKNAGVDILATANNHSCDRNKKGILRTIKVLDSLDLGHTGTFSNAAERETTYPFLIEKNGIKIALLNYTYGTNGIPVPEPAIVNLTDTKTIEKDIVKAKSFNPDAIVVFFHWGTEYQSTPNQDQEYLTKFCFNRGANYVIGSHPHVIQKIEWIKDTLAKSETYAAYSLGNYISNMRKKGQDGGLMLRLDFAKDEKGLHLTQSGYYLAYVYRPVIDEKISFFVLPVSQFENNALFFADAIEYNKMNIFKADSRSQMNTQNTGVREYIWNGNSWVLE